MVEKSCEIAITRPQIKPATRKVTAARKLNTVPTLLTATSMGQQSDSHRVRPKVRFKLRPLFQ